MFSPLIQILIYLSSTFLLGFALGWLIWKFGVTHKMESEITFWKDYLEQSRRERDQDQEKIATLEQQRDNLKKHVESLRS